MRDPGTVVSRRDYGKGNLVPIVAVFNGTVEYRGSLAKMGALAPGCALLLLRKDVREAPGTITLGKDARAAVDDAGLGEAFDAVWFPHQREFHQWIEDAKRPETRARRIGRMVERLADGRRTARSRRDGSRARACVLRWTHGCTGSNLMARRAPGTPAGLDTDQVAAAALEVVFAHGVAGLSMRRVAQRLRVAPNALYSHVADKDALLDRVTDDLLRDGPTGEDDGWRIRLEAIARYVWGTLAPYPSLAARLLERQSQGPHMTALREAADAALAEARVSDDHRHAAVRALFALAVGVAATGNEAGQATMEFGAQALLDSIARGAGR